MKYHLKNWYCFMQLDEETLKFLKEREDRLGAKIVMRTYALFYLSGDGEKREYGVFMYTDGNTFIFEDFDRPPTFLGIEIKRKNKEKYVKMEHSFKKEDVTSISFVTRNDAIRSVKEDRPCKEASRFAKMFRKVLLELVLKDGTRYYFEMMDPKGFIKLLKQDG